MDPQDQELLDKQLRHVAVPLRHDGIVIAAMVALFLGGMIIGGLLTEPRAPTRAQTQVAANAFNAAPATTQQ